MQDIFCGPALLERLGGKALFLPSSLGLLFEKTHNGMLSIDRVIVLARAVEVRQVGCSQGGCQGVCVCLCVCHALGFGCSCLWLEVCGQGGVRRLTLPIT